MHELERIAAEASTLVARRSAFLVATVVRVEGSSYRRPGARMLVAGDRWLAGCVSGGCLEGDVLLRGAHRCAAGPVVITYDSTSDDGAPYGLGCNGIVDVLLEHVPPGGSNDALRFAAACFEHETSGVLVTVIRSTRPDIAVGARWAVGPDLELARPITDPVLRDAARGPSGVVSVGGVTLLVETIAPSPQLFVLGSGHDAAPLARLAKLAGFRVTVADHAIREPSRFLGLGVDRLLSTGGRTDDLRTKIDRAREAYVAILHHQEAADRAALAMALDSRARYIGVLGPAKRTRELLGDRAADPRLHAPIGLDLGAETPEQVALAIVAELTAVQRGGRGGMLRDRTRALHASVAIAVLAAGASRRLGHPKQLVELAGVPLVRHVAATCAALRAGPVGVVLGAHADQVEPALEALAVARIANPRWEEGIAASIRAAIAWARSTGADAVIVALGDQPRIATEQLAKLRGAWLAGAAIAASRHGDVVGAPAIFDRSRWPMLEQLTGDRGAGALLRDPDVVTIDCPDAALDVDTVEDLKLLE
ncbi:MAG TPA: NTP transferase domain-containing protein [Kofleriaceae bacterium]|nr:NTP transferase domain-containing protein [Kofleriaceae bacterium]